MDWVGGGVISQEEDQQALFPDGLALTLPVGAWLRPISLIPYPLRPRSHESTGEPRESRTAAVPFLPPWPLLGKTPSPGCAPGAVSRWRALPALAIG